MPDATIRSNHEEDEELEEIELDIEPHIQNDDHESNCDCYSNQYNINSIITNRSDKNDNTITQNVNLTVK